MKRLCKPLSFAVAGLLTIASAPSFAGLQGQLNTMFGEMSATTNPQVVMGARRGVITGGAFSMRSPIVPIGMNAINYTPPGITAGCSGIDAYGGSLSFISGQQFVQLLRSIAANAEGFAFQLALSSMSSQISNLLSSSESQLLSRLTQLKSSCEAAQAGLNTLGINQSSVNQAAQNIETSLGIATDSNAAAVANTPQSPAVQTVASTPAAKLIYHNVMWDALKAYNFANAYGEGTDASTYDEEIMSLVGYVITCNPNTTKNCAPSSASTNATGGVGLIIGQPTLRLEDLIYGSTDPQSGTGKSQYYVCADTTQCMDVSTTNWNGNGVLSLVQTELGTSASQGFLGVLLQNDPADPEVTAFLSSAGPVGVEIERVARANPIEAYPYAVAVAQPIAIQIAYNDALSLLSAAARTISGSSEIGAKRQMVLIDSAVARLGKDYQSLLNEQKINTGYASLARVYMETNSSKPGAPNGAGSL